MNQREKAYVQYSKRVTTAILIIWAIQRILSLVFLLINSDLGSPLTALQKGADDVAMVAIGFYCGNSVAEKGIVGYFKSRKESEENIENG